MRLRFRPPHLALTLSSHPEWTLRLTTKTTLTFFHFQQSRDYARYMPLCPANGEAK